MDGLPATPTADSSSIHDNLRSPELINFEYSPKVTPKLSSSTVTVSTPKTTQINKLKESLTKEKRRVRAVRAKLYRAQRKLESMKELFEELKSKSYISDNANDTLQVYYNFKCHA